MNYQKLIQKNKTFFNKFAKNYDNKLFKKWIKRIREKIITEARIKNNSKILDAGCGTGELLKLLPLQKNLKLYGIDVSDKMLEVARKKLGNKANLGKICINSSSGKNQIKANLKLSSVENANFRDNSFDYIFSEDAFHHYSNYELAMKNFYRILKKNGKLIVADIDFGFILNKIFHFLEPGNNKMHSKKQFIELFKKYGFKKIKQKKLSFIHILTIGEK